ncbi:MAG: glycosyltransferase family 2 protein [Gammaproteobacteria bacterium]
MQHEKLVLTRRAFWGRTAEWLLLLSALMGLALLLPRTSLSPGESHFLLAIGAVGVWRYALRAIHFTRAMLFLHMKFPALRRRADDIAAAEPPHIYFLATSFRIDAMTTAKVYRSVIEEAVACTCPSTVIASIVELSDRFLINALWDRMNPPQRVKLQFVRIAGTGKRDGLAHGFRAISRAGAASCALVVVVDGDSILQAGLVRKCAPLFQVMPRVGALTTNEFCTVRGGRLVGTWHRLRFAERHLNMCSMALTGCVLTLTGRTSVFRASIVTDPRFIADIEHDSLLHWRLGRFRFLTGDDKSSWFSVVRLGWKTSYVPDVSIRTIEHPPHPSFIATSRQLMFRWYGNSMRQNSRARKLGPTRLGWFTYYVLQDQRAQMWTGLLGLAAALLASVRYDFHYLMAFVVWVGFTRCLMCLTLWAAGHSIEPLFAPLMYYNQVLGSITKIVVSAFPDRQSWTRQHTTLKRDLSAFHTWFNPWSSRAVVFAATSVFAAIVTTIVFFKSPYR